MASFIIFLILLIPLIHWVKFSNRIDKQFKQDATGMSAKSASFGKVYILLDMNNGYVIIDKYDKPIKKKSMRPIYF